MTVSDEQGPASFAQERLWFLDRLTPGTAQYTVWAALHLHGRLDLQLLQQAVDAVVDRHDALRTTFTEARDGVLATVASGSAVRVTAGPVAAAQDVAELVKVAARRPFDLSAGPLLRVTVWRLADSEHVMLVMAHHIVADAWSVAVLLADLGTAYTAAALGHDPRLPAPAIGSLQVARRQRERLEGPDRKQLRDFWTGYLAGAPLVLDLPTDRPRPPILGHHGAVHRWRLPDPLVRDVRRLSLEAGATTFTVLLAGFAAVLGRWSRQDDLIIGVPMANRTEVELDDLVSCLVNALPVRVDLRGAPSFAELVDRVQETLLDTLEHQEFPFEQLVDALHPGRTLSHTPVFQVVCTMAPDAGPGLRAPGLTSIPVPVDTGTAKFDLTLTLESTDEGLHASLEYRTELFEPATVARLAGHLETLLGAAAGNPRLPLPRLPLLTAVERGQLAEWAGPARAAGQRDCLHDQFRAQVRRTPTAVAVRHAGSDLSYAEIDFQSDQLADRLRALGVGPDALVAVCLDRRPELIVAILATLKAGGAYLPLDPSWPAQRLAFMLDDAQALAVLTSHGLQHRLPPTTRPIIMIDDQRERGPGNDAAPPLRVTTADNLAYVIYTSGSSGQPKGVAVTHASVTALLQATDSLLAGGGSDVWTMFHSPAFDFSVWELWGALLHGGRLVLVDQLVSRSPVAFAKLLREEGVTVLSQTPSALAALEAGELADAPPRLLVLGGEALHPAIVQPWLSRHSGRCCPVNMYGTTETTVHATAQVLTSDDEVVEATGSRIGRPLGHVYIRVLDPWLMPVPVGVPGELCIGGPGLARGYLHRPGLTADRFVPDPDPPSPGARLYRTGDLGRYRPDGQLEFLGRADRQVKLRGFRIEPGEVEATLARHPAVRQAVVTADHAITGGAPRLVAYLVPNDPSRPIDVAEVRRWLRDWLPDHMVPGGYVVLEALPRTPSGKLDPGALPPPAPDRAHLDVVFLPPRTSTQRRLAAIWRNVLGIDQVGIGDDFFDLGGHSLLATSVISRIREAFGVEVGVAAFFTGAATIAELADQVEALRGATSGGADDDSGPRPLARDQGVALSTTQQRFWSWMREAPPGHPHFNMGAALLLTGPLDLELLSRNLTRIVSRHEALRTVFAERSGQPLQVVVPCSPVAVGTTDLSSLPEGLREAAAERAVAEAFRYAFDLARGPLLRVSVLRLATNQHVLVLVMHHLVSDGWSLDVMLHELAALGEGERLPPLPFQYPDYAVWQRRRVASNALDHQRVFWRRQLSETAPALELRTDHPRPELRTLAAGNRTTRLPTQLVHQARRLAQQQGATPFMALLPVVAAVLSSRSGQDDFIIGMTTAGRNRLTLEPLVGCFVNTLPVRVSLAGHPSFLELLTRIRAATLAAYAHQDLPFQEIEAMRPPGWFPHGLVQVLYVADSPARWPRRLPGVACAGFPIQRESTQFDLVFDFSDDDQGPHVRLEFSSQIFTAATADLLLGDLCATLERVVARPDEPAVAPGGRRG